MRRNLQFLNLPLFGALFLLAGAVLLALVGLPSAGAAVDDGIVVPAPLADPTVCGYFRLKEGFDRLMAGGAPSGSAEKPLATDPASIFADSFRAAAQVRSQVRANARGEALPKEKKPGRATAGRNDSEAAMQAIRAFCAARAFVPEDLFVFVRGPGEYVAMVTGNITPQAWESLFDASSRTLRGSGFTVNAAGSDGAADRSILHVGPGYLLLAPAGLEGNLLDALQAGATLDGDTWKTFRNMVGLRPVAALEADLERFLDRSRETGAKNALLPFPYDGVRLLRCLVDARVVKAQAYAPDEHVRTLLRQSAGVIAKTIRTAAAGSPFADSFGSMSESVHNTSVFIEGRGLDRNTPLAGVSTLGMLSQLICRAFPAAGAD